MVKAIKINGKVYDVNFNASNEVTKPEPEGLSKDFFTKATRLRVAVDGTPVIKLDDTEVKLGYYYRTDEEKAIYKDYVSKHRGTGGAVSQNRKDLDKYAREALKLSGLSKEARAFFESCLLEDQLVTKAIKSLMALGFDEITARKMATTKASQKE